MPQAVVAAAAWAANAVASVVGSAVLASGANWGVTLAARYITFQVVSTVSQIALYAGMQYAVDAISRPKQKPTGSELNLNFDPAYPREMVVGERLVGGSMVARYSRGSNLYNAHMVIQLADHPCVALNKVYDNGRLVWSTPLTHGTRTEITSYSYSGGARVWMTWHDGRPGQTADSDLVTKSAQDPEVIAGKIPGWSSNHKGAGCAYVHVEVQWDSDILTSIPSFTFLVQGAKFYDRRLDTTAGGSGSHRLDDPSTWEYTTNAAVVWDHYSLGYKVEDDDLAFGIGLTKTELPYAQFAAAADLADEDMDTGTGGGAATIKRYAINGVLSSATLFEDQLEDFQIQMAGRIVDLGGRIGLIGAEERISTVSLTDDDLTSDDALQFADKLAFADLYGAVEGNFADPGNLYQATPYDRQTTAYAQLPDGGEAQTVNLDLPLEIHPRRAVRNVSAWLKRESLQARLIACFMPLAWPLEVGDWFDFTSTRLQLDAAMFEVIDIVKNADFTVTLTARAIDPDFVAFSVDDDPDLSVPPDVDPVDLLLEEPTGTLIAVSLSGGGATEPALRFTLATIDTLAREYVIEIQEWNGSALTGDPWTVTGHSDELINMIRAGVLPDRQYKARIKARAGIRESPWTDWSSAVSTSATYLVPNASVGASITGQGALATLNGVYFGSSLITETSGGSSATLGNFKTALGTAAAISGQGWGATASEANAANSRSGQFPFDFTYGVRDWFGGFGGDPASVADAPGTIVTETGEGKCYQVSNTTNYLQPKMAIKSQPNRRYLVLARYRQKTNPTSGIQSIALTINPMDSSFTHQATAGGVNVAAAPGFVTNASGFLAASGWLQVAGIYTCPATIPTDGVYWRPRLDMTSGTNGVIQCSRFLITDITDGVAGRTLTDLLRADLSTAVTEALIVTALGTASAITGQGGLATLNAVGSGQISANAVTQGSIQENDSAVTLTTSYQDLATVTVTVPDSSTLVKVDWSLYLDSANYDAAVDNEVYLEITRTIGAGSPSQIFESFIGGNPAALHYEISGGTESFDVPCIFVGIKSGFDTDQPGAGSITYKIRGKKTGSGSASCDVSKRRLFAMMFKR
jgi:hypothetical protein